VRPTPDANADAHSNTNSDKHAEPDAHQHARAHSNAGGNGHPHGRAHSEPYANDDAEPDCHTVDARIDATAGSGADSTMIWCEAKKEAIPPVSSGHDLCPLNAHHELLPLGITKTRLREWHTIEVEEGRCCAHGEGQVCCLEMLLL